MAVVEDPVTEVLSRLIWQINIDNRLYASGNLNPQADRGDVDSDLICLISQIFAFPSILVCCDVSLNCSLSHDPCFYRKYARGLLSFQFRVVDPL